MVQYVCREWCRGSDSIGKAMHRVLTDQEPQQHIPVVSGIQIDGKLSSPYSLIFITKVIKKQAAVTIPDRRLFNLCA